MAGTYNAGLGVDASRKGVNGDDMRGLVVPWTVFAPVGSRHLLPRVVEGYLIRKDLHGGVCRGGSSDQKERRTEFCSRCIKVAEFCFSRKLAAAAGACVACLVPESSEAQSTIRNSTVDTAVVPVSSLEGIEGLCEDRESHAHYFRVLSVFCSFFPFLR